MKTNQLPLVLLYITQTHLIFNIVKYMLDVLLGGIHEADTAIFRKLLKEFLHTDGAISTSIICI